MSHTLLQRRSLPGWALLCSLLAQVPSAAAQAPAAAAPTAPAAAAPAAAAPGAPAPAAAGGAPARPSATASAAAQRFVNPHGNRQTMAHVVPASDLALGEIEVRLASNEANLIDAQEVKLNISKQSIAQGNTTSSVADKTNLGGVARFQNQAAGTDFIYTVTANVGGAQFSSPQFQFRAGGAGMRVLLPVYKSSTDVNGLLVLSRALYAIIPQDNIFSIDMLWRIENYSEMAWVPDAADKSLRFVLPAGAKAVQIQESPGDARFVTDGDDGVRLAGTFAPGQHDLMLRFHLDTDTHSERNISFPASIHLGSMRVLLDSAPGMVVKIDGVSEIGESRNSDGQRRLIASRDFLKEKTRAPERIEVHISGIPTQGSGRNYAVALAAMIAAGGVVASLGRFRAKTPARSQLSKEDRDRAGELLLEELIRLEQAFKQGEIGRKTHDSAKRQLLEAYARLGAGSSPAAA